MFDSLFQWLLGAGRELAVVIISMVPLVELRGAVPLGVMAAGMPWYEVLPLAYLGNLLPIPFALFFGEKVLDWVGTLRPFTGFVTRYKAKLESKKDQVTKYARIGLFLFVAVPLPGTGAWSGALIATLLEMPKGKALERGHKKVCVCSSHCGRRRGGGAYHAGCLQWRAGRGEPVLKAKAKSLP